MKVLQVKSPVLIQTFSESLIHTFLVHLWTHVYVCFYVKVKVLVAQPRPTLRPLDGSSPGSCVRGIIQAGILEWMRDIPHSEIELESPTSQAGSLPPEPQGQPPVSVYHKAKHNSLQHSFSLLFC